MSQDPQVSFLNKVYAILTATEGAAPEASPMNPIYVAFCTPGIPLPITALNFDLTTKNGSTNLAQWSQLVNTIPNIQSNSPLSITYSSSKGTWNASGNKLDNVYDDFLSGAQANVPDFTPQEKEMHDKALGYLQSTKTTTDPFSGVSTTQTVDSDAYAQNKKCKLAYETAMLAYNSSKITAISSSNPLDKNTFAVQGPLLQSKITDCYQDWVGSGNKAYVEEALNILDNLSVKGLVGQITDAKTNFDSSSVLDPVFGSFHAVPPVPIEFFQDPQDSSWTTYSYDHTESDSYSDSSSANIGGSASIGGLDVFGFTIGGGGDMNIQKTTVTSDDDNWRVAFDLVQLPLARGWFRFDLLNSKEWFWSKGSSQYGNSISLGHIPLQPSEEALMPIYPTSVLLVRNVEITTKTDNISNAISKFDQSVDVHIGWGPFNLGSVRESSSSETASNHVLIDANSLKSEGIAIIGFICEIIQNKLPQGVPNS